MDYKKLNASTEKDHFLIPFMDQMLDRLAEKGWYYFLDGYFGYKKIIIALEYHNKTTFTCPYSSFAFKGMPFGLCNAQATFQRYMISIFLDMVDSTIEVFMDDFSMLGNSFEDCLVIRTPTELNYQLDKNAKSLLRAILSKVQKAQT